MTITEYIAKLEAIRAEHGELLVDTFRGSGIRTEAPDPRVAYRKILSPRESRPSFWDQTDGLTKKGSKVVQV
jgi:hypothetical protein